MKQSEIKTRTLIIVTILVVFTLLILQIRWYKGAISLKAEFENSELLRIMPDIAIAVNSIDHDIFHIEKENLDDSIVPLIENTIIDELNAASINRQVAFAIFQDTINGIFLSNQEILRDEFLQSNLKHCITCISEMSFTNDDFDFYSYENSKLSDDELTKKLKENSTVSYYTPITSLVDKKDGEIVWISIIDKSKKDSRINQHMTILGFSVLLIGIFLSLFFRLLASFNKQRALSKVKEEIVNNMTHEFKTPLSSIRLAANLLSVEKEANNLEFINIIKKESEALETQIDQILNFGKLQETSLEDSFELFDIHVTLKNIGDKFKMMLINKNGYLNYKLKAKNSRILGNNELLSTAIENIVDNSLKYSQEGVQVEIITMNRGKRLEICIKDNGPGIAFKYQPHIFDRFFRAQEGNKYKGKGFGIGLSYTKEIIEGHDGKISLVQSSEQGTEFSIIL